MASPDNAQPVKVYTRLRPKTPLDAAQTNNFPVQKISHTPTKKPKISTGKENNIWTHPANTNSLHSNQKKIDEDKTARKVEKKLESNFENMSSQFQKCQLDCENLAKQNQDQKNRFYQSTKKSDLEWARANEKLNELHVKLSGIIDFQRNLPKSWPYLNTQDGYLGCAQKIALLDEGLGLMEDLFRNKKNETQDLVDQEKKISETTKKQMEEIRANLAKNDQKKNDEIKILREKCQKMELEWSKGSGDIEIVRSENLALKSKIEAQGFGIESLEKRLGDCKKNEVKLVKENSVAKMSQDKQRLG
jgi:hypothetical protein